MWHSRGAMLAMFLAASLSGCASFERAKPAPVQTQPVTLQINNEPLSGWSDMPIGVYRVPDSQTVISGQQSGGMAPVLLFGLVGLAAQHAAGAGASEEAVRETEKHLRIDMAKELSSASERLLAAGTYKGRITNQSENLGPVLQVSGSLVLTFVSDTTVRPFVVLKTNMLDPKTKETMWSTRYFSSSGTALPLTGDNSWTADSGAKLQQQVRKDMEKGLAFLLKDVVTPYARTEEVYTTVQGHYPFVRKRLQSIGYKLVEDDNSIAYVPRVGDVIVFAGVNIFDKNTVTSRPATKEDISAFLKVLEEAPPQPQAQN